MRNLSFMQETLRALLFDADGTLIDTYDMILRSMRYTVQKYLHLDLTNDELMKGVGTPLFDQFLIFCHGNKEKANELSKVYRAHMEKSHDKLIATFTDSASALAMLHAKNYRMAVVTSKPHELAKRGLTLTHLTSFFEFIIAADDYPKHKPHPGPILYGCERLHIAPKHVAYIGDSPYDIKAGNAAGTYTIAALWGMFSRDTLSREHPDFFAKSLTEIAEKLPDLTR